MTDFVIAETATGTVFNLCRSPEEFSVLEETWPVPPGHSIYEASDVLAGRPSDYYVSGGDVLERAEQDITLSAETMAADGDDEVTLSGLETPCVVTFSGAASGTQTVSAGSTFSFTCAVAGVLTILVTKDPTHKPWEGSVIAG